MISFKVNFGTKNIEKVDKIKFWCDDIEIGGKRKIMGKRIKWIPVALVLVLAISIFASCGYDATLKTGNVEKISKLNTAANGDFKILQLTDLHLTSNGSYAKDRETLRWVEESVEIAQPDLVVVTGDATAGDVKGRNAGLLAMANIFEKKQVYWAYTFGNHDGEHDVDANGKAWWNGRDGKQYVGNESLYKLLTGYEYSLMVRDPLEIPDPSLSEQEQEQIKDDMGVGNYVIDLMHNDKHVFSLIFMDSHGKNYFRPVDENGNAVLDDKGEPVVKDKGYDGLSQMQIEWYKQKAQALNEKNISSAIFMHVPNYGFRQVFEELDFVDDDGYPHFKYKSDLPGQYKPDSKYDGYEFVMEEDGIYAPRWDDGLFDAMKEYPTTNLIGVGHDHNNSILAQVALAELQQVLLCYGRTSGVNAWSRDIPIGATLYTVHTSASDTIDMYDISIIWPTFSYGNR